MLSTGTIAPDFELPNQNWGTTIRLSDFRGRKNVVVAFHPLNFTPVCSAQMKTYEASKAEFDALDAHVLSISCDAGPSQKAWADQLGLTMDLLADFHPKGAVAEAYGAMRPDGVPERAIFVVDKTGKIVWTAKYDMADQPPVSALIAALQQLQ